MNNVSTKLLVGTVVVTALLTVVFPAPVAAESGTVSVNAPDSASPGDEVTVSFEVTNTGEEPSSYILDLSLPEGYTITDRVDNDGQWKSGESKWLWQTIETGDSNTKVVEIDVETPEDASSSDTISVELKTATGIEETTSISIIESRSDGKHSITGEIVDFDGNSIENTGDTEVTISRIDTDGDSSTVLVDSIPFSEFDTLASANSDVSSASFSENGNDPATYSITLLHGDGLTQYQITADRADYEPFSATTGPLDAGESTAQNILLQDVDEPKSSDIILEDTISATGSKVTIMTDNASAIRVSELPEDVKISDISDGGIKDRRSILYSSIFSELPATVSFRLNPDSGAYSEGDTVDFVVEDSSVSLDVVSQSEVQISSVELSRKRIATGTSTHDLRINVDDLSPDDEPDVFTITIPKSVEVVDVSVVDSNVDLIDRPSAANTMEFSVNPTETTTAELELELMLSKTTSSPPLPPETP